VILPPLLSAVVDLEWRLRILACLMCLIVLSGIVFEVKMSIIIIIDNNRLLKKKTPREATTLLLDSSSSTPIIPEGSWSTKKYLTWSLIIPLALFGYYVPYIHLVRNNL